MDGHAQMVSVKFAQIHKEVEANVLLTKYIDIHEGLPILSIAYPKKKQFMISFNLIFLLKKSVTDQNE
jgi:hypothetical protein